LTVNSCQFKEFANSKKRITITNKHTYKVKFTNVAIFVPPKLNLLNFMKKHFIPILILSLVVFVSCSNNEAGNTPVANNNNAAELQKIEAEKQKLEQERQKLEEEKLRQAEESRRQTVVANAKLEQQFPPYTQGVVVVGKTFFHSSADPATARGAFLVSGDVCVITKVNNGFGYIDFYNSNNGKTTSGWINLRDLEPIYDAG